MRRWRRTTESPRPNTPEGHCASWCRRHIWSRSRSTEGFRGRGTDLEYRGTGQADFPSVRIAALPGQFLSGADDTCRKEVGVRGDGGYHRTKAGGASAGNIGGEKPRACRALGLRNLPGKRERRVSGCEPCFAAVTWMRVGLAIPQIESVPRRFSLSGAASKLFRHAGTADR